MIAAMATYLYRIMYLLFVFHPLVQSLKGCIMEHSYQSGHTLPGAGYVTQALECFEHCEQTVECSGASFDINYFGVCWPYSDIVYANRMARFGFFLYIKNCTEENMCTCNATSVSVTVKSITSSKSNVTDQPTVSSESSTSEMPVSTTAQLPEVTSVGIRMAPSLKWITLNTFCLIVLYL